MVAIVEGTVASFAAASAFSFPSVPRLAVLVLGDNFKNWHSITYITIMISFKSTDTSSFSLIIFYFNV